MRDDSLDSKPTEAKRQQSMKADEWRTLMDLARAAGLDALADKCSYREMSLRNGVVVP